MSESWKSPLTFKSFVEHPDAVKVQPAEIPVGRAIRVEYDGADRPTALRLDPRWQRAVPAPVLANVLTAMINNHRLPSPQDVSTPRTHRLWDSSMPVRVAQDLQVELARIQREQLQAFDHASRADVITVKSRNRHLTVLIHMTNVVAVEINPSWIATASGMAITETFEDAMARAAQAMDQQIATATKDRAQEKLQRIGETLTDYEKG